MGKDAHFPANAHVQADVDFQADVQFGKPEQSRFSARFRDFGDALPVLLR